MCQSPQLVFLNEPWFCEALEAAGKGQAVLAYSWGGGGGELEPLTRSLFGSWLE